MVRKKHGRSINKLVPKTKGQEIYLDCIDSNIVTICNGLAGTGKSLLAVGKALELYRERPDTYKRIIMVRPAIPACDEDLGYLPGEMEEKMAPFMVPMVESLRVFMNDSEIDTMLRYKEIEVLPIAYMRGRNFNNAVVIMDEAQNATVSQVKMFLTRIGMGCKVIIEGDVTQSDIRVPNGLADAIDRLHRLDDVGIVALGPQDIVRSAILSRVLERYETR